VIRALGIDVGTSGVRAAVVDATKAVVSYAAEPFAPGNGRSPRAWVAAVETAVARLDLTGIEAVAIDGTSGTLVAVDARGEPLADGSMYNDEAAPDDRAEAARAAPAHAAPTSPLARALGLKRRFKPAKILHQADFVALRLFGETFTDENNALKTGYDPLARRWPDFVAALGLDGLLPDVLPAGALAARRDGRRIVAGTTDGCAAFLAAGAEHIGEGVTSLGSTIVLKLLVDHPVDDPETGVYSHRIGDLWLAGGSSNGGGAVLARYFQPDERSMRFRIGSIRCVPPGSTITRCSTKASAFPSATPSARRSSRPDPPTTPCSCKECWKR
jgi:sugar (pentulose or hexulose) kinase